VLFVKLRRDWHRFELCTFFTHMSYELASNLARGANASIWVVSQRPHVLSCPTILRLNHQKRRLVLPRPEVMICFLMRTFVTLRQVRRGIHIASRTYDTSADYALRQLPVS
jgi:hypothetical protein